MIMVTYLWLQIIHGMSFTTMLGNFYLYKMKSLWNNFMENPPQNIHGDVSPLSAPLQQNNKLLWNRLRVAMDIQSHLQRRVRVFLDFIFKGCQLLVKYKKRALAVFFCLLEATSVVLDLIGRSKTERNIAASRTQAGRQIGVMEIVFCAVQLIATFLHYISTVLDFNNSSFNVPVYSLAFAVILVVFVFQKDKKFINSLSSTTNSPPVDSVPSFPVEVDTLGSTVDRDNPTNNLRLRRMAHADREAQVVQLMRDNIQILTHSNITTQRYLSIEAENSVSKAEAMKLRQRLEYLSIIIEHYLSTEADNSVLKAEFAELTQRLESLKQYPQFYQKLRALFYQHKQWNF